MVALGSYAQAMRICLACERRFDGPSWRCPGCGQAPSGREILRFAPEFSGEEGMLEESFDHLESVEEGSFWFRSRNRLIAWALAAYAPAATSFLEVGCGTGFVSAELARRFPSLRICAGDPFDAGVAVASRRMPSAAVYQMDARRIPFDREFDVVGAFDVLEHVREHEQVIAQMRQAVVPGGTVIVTVPQHDWLWSPLDDYAQHQRRYTRRQLVDAMRAAGLRPVRVTSFVTLLLPLMLASRLRGRNRPVDPTAEFGLPPWLDRSLERVMDAETALIGRGASLPAGGSLLAVGRRDD